MAVLCRFENVCAPDFAHVIDPLVYELLIEDVIVDFKNLHFYEKSIAFVWSCVY
jgi:hypothetical protein